MLKAWSLRMDPDVIEYFLDERFLFDLIMHDGEFGSNIHRIVEVYSI